MKEIQWDETLSVQLEEIDEDHRRLVDLYNLLHGAVSRKENQDYVAALLEEMVTCTRCHFRHEERLMVKYGYPQAKEHREEHDALVQSARDLQRKRLEAGKDISQEDVEFLEHWLVEHILGMDMDLGAFLVDVM